MFNEGNKNITVYMQTGCSMRFVIIFIMLILIFGVASPLFGYVYSNYGEKNYLEEHASNQLISIAQSKADRISVHFDEVKKDAIFLAESSGIQNVMDKEPIRLTGELDNELKFFQKINNYSNIILMDSRGDKIWIAKDSYNPVLNDFYHKVKQDLDEEIFGQMYYEEYNPFTLFVTAPIFITGNKTSKKILKGIIVLELDKRPIEKIIDERDIEDFGEIYIVNREGIPVSPVKSESNGEKVVNIDTQIYRDCFRDYDNEIEGKTEPVKKAGFYQNYANKPVLGAYQYISGPEWCVLVEVDKDFAQALANDMSNWKQTFYLFLVILGSLIIITGLVLDRFFELKRSAGK
jgi:hypothetical protein